MVGGHQCAPHDAQESLDFGGWGRPNWVLGELGTALAHGQMAVAQHAAHSPVVLKHLSQAG